MKKLAVILLAMLLCCSSALATETDLSSFTTEQLQAELERRENEGRPMEIYKYLFEQYQAKYYYEQTIKEFKLFEYPEEGYSSIFLSIPDTFEYGDFGYRVTAWVNRDRPDGRRVGIADIPEYISVFAHACLEDGTYSAVDRALSELNTNPGITVPGDKVTSIAQVGEHTLTLVIIVDEYHDYNLTFTVS
ncbi:MAG: hypothetical protein RR893_08220 [Clostridia bacterium]